MSEITEQERRQRKLEEYENSPEYKEKIIHRLKINDACNRSNEAKVYALAACKADVHFFINNFCWTPNDKYEQYHFPFIEYPFQEDYIDWLNKHIDEGSDGLADKSREMGATWLMQTNFLHRWLFDDNFNALVGSYKESLVDDRTKDSLFGMLDYQLRSIPKWMLPKRFSFKNHRTHMKLVNPESQNLIKGDTMNPEFGRGSRRTLIFMDEGAHWEYFQDAWMSSGDTTNCRLTVSTPKGYNAFAALKESGIDTITLRWDSHPLKDQEWYEYEKGRRTEEELAQEVDISYSKSQAGRVYPEWANVEFGDYPYDPTMPLYVSWDFGKRDPTAIIWAQRDSDNDKVRIIDCYWNNGKLIDFYIPIITGILPSDGYKYTNRDLKFIDSHKSWRLGTHFGDPAGRFSNQVVNDTVLSTLKLNGIYVNFRKNWNYFSERIPAAKLLIRDRILLNQTENNKYLNICMLNSQYGEVKSGGMTIINSENLKPKHDPNSHLRSAFEYLALGLKDYSRVKRKVYDKFPIKPRGSKVLSY